MRDVVPKTRREAGWRWVPALVAALALLGAIALGGRADGQAGGPRVVFVTFNCEQGNFVCPGATRALRRAGVRGRIVSPDPREDRVGTLSLLAKGGYDLVIVDLEWRDTLATVAPRFPDVRFALFDAPLDVVRGRPRNVQGIIHRPHEAAYLAGWLAARLERRRPGRDVVGAVGGARIVPVDDFIIGFRAGARSASPTVTVLTDYSDDFTDPSRCEAIARRQIARGAGVVFNVAGGCGLGTLRAAKRAGVWGIGVDTDQSFLGPHILTSVVKRYDVGFLRLLRQVRSGRIRTGGTTVLTLRSGGAGLGRVSPKVPVAIRAELNRLRRRIVAGDVRVPGAPELSPEAARRR
jgi:basic membrane protein A and related proteins